MEYLTGRKVLVLRLPVHLEKRVGRFYTRDQRRAGIPARVIGTNGRNMYLLKFDSVEPPGQDSWLFFQGEFELVGVNA
jgi:hypothetical protein